MIRVAAWCFDVSDAGLRRLVQLGVERADSVPIPTDDRGVFDLAGAITLQKRISFVHVGRTGPAGVHGELIIRPSGSAATALSSGIQRHHFSSSCRFTIAATQPPLYGAARVTTPPPSMVLSILP